MCVAVLLGASVQRPREVYCLHLPAVMHDPGWSNDDGGVDSDRLRLACAPQPATTMHAHGSA
jgi:hypothetical protein